MRIDKAERNGSGNSPVATPSIAKPLATPTSTNHDGSPVAIINTATEASIQSPAVSIRAVGGRSR